MTLKKELGKAGVVVLPPVAPELPESQIIMARLEALGWTFRLNLCDETIEVNGHPLGDIIKAEIRVALRDIGLHKKIAAAEDAYYALAKRNSYHPVRDYLDSLKWDGEDHITALASHFASNDPKIEYQDGTKLALFHVYLYRWLIAAVAKIYTGSQNAMLVLDGGQGLGKSTFAHYLCPLPGYFIEGPINPSDKDNDVRLMSQWVWEVSELDATTRKADQSALKSFITKEVVTVRKSYGHHDLKKMAMASMIGTINNTSGFLADESGSRRFMTCKLIHIDRKYQKIDINQVWAQAVQLYRDGETGRLLGEEAAMQAKINERYQVETVLTDWLDRAFAFDPDGDTPYSMAEIIAAMELDGVKLSGSEKGQTMELARVLVQKKAWKVHTRDGKRWFGLIRRPR
jgi:predicted P-loop ATPase